MFLNFYALYSNSERIIEQLYYRRYLSRDKLFDNKDNKEIIKFRLLIDKRFKQTSSIFESLLALLKAIHNPLKERNFYVSSIACLMATP